jgi:LysM repeat protein
VHIVRPGETLWSIAESFGVALPELLALNRLRPRSVIRPGDAIRIPS